MAFGTTLREHHTMVASANMFYIAIGYKNKANMKVQARNINIRIHQMFSEQRILWCPSDHCVACRLYL